MTVHSIKPGPVGRDLARAELAAAIALHAGAKRDLQVAEQAAELVARRSFEAQAKLDELRNEPPAPDGAFAAEFISSIAAGSCSGLASTIRRFSCALGNILCMVK